MKLAYAFILVFLGLSVIQITVGWYSISYSNDISNLLNVHSNTTNVFILLQVIFFVYLFFIGYILKAFVLDPVKKLNKAMKEVGNGNLSVRLKTTSNDEFSKLSESFNKMTKDLKKSTINIKHIGKKVKERTKELESKNSELESVNKMIIERELKMIEMKKRMEKNHSKYQ